MIRWMEKIKYILCHVIIVFILDVCYIGLEGGHRHVPHVVILTIILQRKLVVLPYVRGPDIYVARLEIKIVHQNYLKLLQEFVRQKIRAKRLGKNILISKKKMR